MALHLLFADERGQVYDHPELLALVGDPQALPSMLGAGLPRDRARALPAHAGLQALPGRAPIGLDPRTGAAVALTEMKLGRKVIRPRAVAAVLPPGWTRLALPAFQPRAIAPVLPQWAYAAAAWDSESGAPAVLALHTDKRNHWDPNDHSTADLPARVAAMRQAHPGNPLYAQLEKCALEYRCFTAQNTFYVRDEGAIPASIGCNARCIGCISEQPDDGTSPPSSHERMDQAPKAGAMAELGIAHLAAAPGRTMVSFGQGCEGEPLTQARAIAASIRQMRAATARGSINLNTNGSLPEQLAWVIDAGLDAVRVSLNSAHPPMYEAYYQPIGYSFSDVAASIRLAKERGLYVALNLLTFPGVVDQAGETEALCELIANTSIDQVQVRSLAIDPAQYLAVAKVHSKGGRALGMATMFRRFTQARPGLRIGNFARGLGEREPATRKRSPPSRAVTSARR